MSLMAFLFVLLLIGLAVWVGRRRLALLLATLTLVLFVGAAGGPIPRWMLGSLQGAYAVTEPGSWSARNAIVLLGAGTARANKGAPLEPSLFATGRILRAVALYRECKASGQQCLLLISGGDSQGRGQAEADVYAGVVRRLGVPDQDLQLESRSMNTWQNAQFSRPLLLAYAPQKLVLVTSGIHLRRSLLYFAHFGMRPIPVRGDQVNATYLSWPNAWNLALFDLALHEYLGVLRYRVYNTLGWNARPVETPMLPVSP